MAQKLAAKLPYAEFVAWKPKPTPATRLVYYINYALCETPSGLIDVGFFTHFDQSHQFLERARRVDYCVSMSRLYADWLKAQGIEHVSHIPMGFDSYRYRPRLVLGVAGLLDHPRKGKHLVDHLRRLPFVQILTTEGRISEGQMRDFYQQLDYVLIPATVEGGPMSLLEGLGMGKPVIAPEGVGMVPEFAECRQIRRYRAGDATALEQTVRDCYEEKLQASSLVACRTWDDWAEAHHRLFMSLLKSKGQSPLSPAAGFRFGWLKELDLPWDIDLEPLETAIDQASRHTFYGRYIEAKNTLSEVSSQHPCVSKLIGSLPDRNESPHQQDNSPPMSATNDLPTHSASVELESTSTPRLLLIAHVGTLRDRMDKSHYYRYEALCRREGVKLFGPGLPGYRKGMSVEEAIQMTFGSNRPDVVIHGGDLRDSGIPLVAGLDKTDLLTAIELLDTWANPDRTRDFIRRNRFNIALMQEAGPHLEFYRRNCPQTEFFWTPNGVNTRLFRDYGLQKDYDVILYGMLELVIYPFRTRLTKLLTNTPSLRVRHIEHPGYYRVAGAAHPIVAGADLARAINQAWIGIATRSSYNCLLMKYLEIAASGTAVAGNLPDSGRELFKDCIIELQEGMSDATIIGTLQEHLAAKNRLHRLIAESSQRVRCDFSTDAFADRVMKICNQALRQRSDNPKGHPASSNKQLFDESYQEASRLAETGDIPGARVIYHRLIDSGVEGPPRGLIENDLAVLHKLLGEDAEASHRWEQALVFDPDCSAAKQNLTHYGSHSIKTPAVTSRSRVRVAILSLLFNWPSTGGGTVHTAEVARFLSEAAYEVRHIYAVFPEWGLGKVTEPLMAPSEPLHFTGAEWNIKRIQERFRNALHNFKPDWVIVTDSWNSKPILAEAARDYRFFLRIAAQECLCPLNNVRLLVQQNKITSCPLNQLSTPDRCCQCVSRNGRTSGSLHQAERELVEYGTAEYDHRLRWAFANAEAVLVVNPLIGAMVSPYSKRVAVVPSGFDSARFPKPANMSPRTSGTRLKILFAGLVDELMKGFSVVHQACHLLWSERQDFELLATADPIGQVDPYTRYIGWQSQTALPDIMRDADLLVFPTVAEEALGRTAVEAMGSGRAVVASRIGGLQFTVIDESTGLLFEPGNVDDLYHKLQRLLNNNELRERFGRAGRQQFEEHYTWEAVLAKHYRPLLGEPQTRLIDPNKSQRHE